MRQIRFFSSFMLVLSNTAIALGLTVLIDTWLPTVTAAEPMRFMVVFIMTSAIVAYITVVSIAYAKRNDPQYKWAYSGAFDEALDLREKALNEHTIVCVTSSEGFMTEVNDNFCRVFGYDKSEVLGKKPDILYANATDSARFDDVYAIVSRGGSWRGEQVLQAKDGHKVIVHTTIIPCFDKAGVHTHSISIRTDLTRARTKAALEARNSVIEALPDGVIVYDPATYDIVYVNRQCRERLGWSNEEVEGKNMSDTFQHFDHGLFKRYLAPLMTGEKTAVTIQVEHDKGPIEILTHFDTGPDGRRSLISVVRDITERKQVEAVKLNSVSMVSHELRTPLTSIKGALRLIESGALGAQSGEVARMISVAHRNSDRLLSIVNEILDLEKIDSGKMEFARKDVDLRHLLQEAAEANAGYAEEAGVRFVVDVSEAPAFVHGDAFRLMQVISNLMSNAAKFSPAGAEVVLSIVDRDDAWRVCVKDVGPGIPESAHKTLFDSFFQAPNSEAASRPGTGLGLTISKKIIQRHGGVIAFDTELGKGSVFYFDLAKHSNPAQPAADMDVPNTAVA